MKKTIMIFAAMAMLMAAACTKGGEDNNGGGTSSVGDITLVTWDEEELELDYNSPDKKFEFEYQPGNEDAEYSLLIGMDGSMSGAERFVDDDRDGKVSLTYAEFDGLLERLGVKAYRAGRLYWCIEGRIGESVSDSDIYTISVTRYLKPFVDPRDGEEYRVMRSVDGTTGDYSIWLADNLRADRYSDGTLLTEDDFKFYTPQEGEDGAIRDVLGAYYSWIAVMRGDKGAEDGEKIQGICPTGWHVPTRLEWEYLINNTPDNTNPGEALKDRNYWDAGAANKNTLGFNIAGAGYIWQPVRDNDIIEKGSFTYFWTSTVPKEGDIIPWNPEPLLFPTQALTFAFNKNDHGAALYPYDRMRGFNLRCVLD